jgi:chromosome segregation ATPase
VSTTSPSLNASLQQENEALKTELLELKTALESKEIEQQKAEMRLAAQELALNKFTAQIAQLQSKIKVLCSMNIGKYMNMTVSRVTILFLGI